MKYAALVIAGMTAGVSAFAPAGASISLRSPCTMAATCVRVNTDSNGNYRDDQGNLRNKEGKIVQAGSGRGSDADMIAAYLAEKKAREEQQAIEDAKPKRIIQIDDTTAKWKEQKAREKEEQLAASEAKMAMWMAAAAAKKAAAAEGK